MNSVAEAADLISNQAQGFAAGVYGYAGEVYGDADNTAEDDANAIPPLPSELLQSIKANYSLITMTQTFWRPKGDKKTEEMQYSDSVRGGTMAAYLEENAVSISTGLNVPYLVITYEMLEAFEARNEVFRALENYNEFPFKNLYSYHRKKNNLVLRSNFYAEIVTKDGAGSNCVFIQENEALYDGEGKIIKFQSSLGVEMQMKPGTQYEGTIFTVDFAWEVKE